MTHRTATNIGAIICLSTAALIVIRLLTYLCDTAGHWLTR